MAHTQVALLRGINVGRAKRIAMADLRAHVADLGFGDVRTLLNSGNVVFTSPRASPATSARRIEQALVARLGVTSRVTVLAARELAAVVTANPLAAPGAAVARDPSRLLVAVLANPAGRRLVEPLLAERWAPEELALGDRVAYLWCFPGVLESRLAGAVGRVLGDGVTMRNWSTITRLHALAAAESRVGTLAAPA